MTIAELIRNLQNLVEDDDNNIEFNTPVYIDGDMSEDIPMGFISVEDNYIVISYY